MLSTILSDIICAEFTNVFRNGPKAIPPALPYGMMIQFRSEPPTGHDDSIYHHTDLLLYGKHNYIGVYKRERWNPHTRNAEGQTDWEVLCYHDSCWRTDGVSSFIFQNRERLDGLDTFCNWYLKFPISDTLEATLKAIRDKRYNG
jgi:hypothetical protein